jgi:hypothetical protein
MCHEHHGHHGHEEARMCHEHHGYHGYEEARMCHEHHGHHGHEEARMCHEHRGHAGGCCCEGGGCGPDFPFRRRFPTRAERIARLEEYLQELQAEVQAVQERLAEMKAAG